MAKKINPIIVVGALLAVVGTAVLVGLATRGGDEAAAGDTVKVVVAGAPIAAGTPAASAGLVVKDVAASSVPVGALTDPAAVNGQVALRALAQNEVVLPSSFGISGVAATGGVVLPPGKEGLGVELAFAPGGLRYVVPGNRITVWATPKALDGRDTAARPVLQNVQVIATTPGTGTGAATAVSAAPGTLQFLLALSRAEAAQLIGSQASGASLYFTLSSTKQGS